MNLRARLRQLRRDRRGSVLVEFTLLAPLLVGLMCGLAEFGQGLRQYHVMQKGVRDAARFMSRVPANAPCVAADGRWGTYVAQAQNLAVFGATTSGSPLFKGWTSPATVTVANPSCEPNPRVGGGPLPKIRVTATAPYAELGMLRVLGLGPITLSVFHEELKVS